MKQLIAVVAILVAPIIAEAQDVGDNVSLRATHHLGIPVHSLPQGTHDFRRVPDGTTGEVLALQDDDRWMDLQLSGHGRGWVNRKYFAAVIPSPAPTPPVDDLEEQVWGSPEGCDQALATDNRMAKPADTLRLVTWNIRWFPKGCSSGEDCPENATNINWLACSITWMGADLIALQEILDHPPARQELAALTSALDQLTGGSWENDLHECGPPQSQHVGFLWNSSRIKLENHVDIGALNGAFSGGSACASNLRPGRYARAISEQQNGADFQILSVHLDSGRTDRDYQNRSRSFAAIPELLFDGNPIFQIDADVLIVGDFNTMGREEPPEITADEEIEALDDTLTSAYARRLPTPQCSEYFEGKAGLLDHFIASQAMQEAGITAQVTGYCAIDQCADISNSMPAAYEQLSDHCPLVLDIHDADLD
jgi:endonuclease/exonuclease/phosphatase family metal-dependent hydrolase